MSISIANHPDLIQNALENYTSLSSAPKVSKKVKYAALGKLALYKVLHIVLTYSIGIKKIQHCAFFFIFHDFLWYGRLIRILKKTVLMEIRTIETNKDLLYLVIEHLIYKSCVQVSAGPFLDGWKVSRILIRCGLGLSYSNLLLAFAGVKHQFVRQVVLLYACI